MTDIETEICEKCGVKGQRKKEDEQRYLMRVLQGLEKLSDEEFFQLSEEAQSWADKAVDAVTAATEIPSFASDEADEDEEENEEDDTEEDEDEDEDTEEEEEEDEDDEEDTDEEEEEEAEEEDEDEDEK